MVLRTVPIDSAIGMPIKTLITENNNSGYEFFKSSNRKNEIHELGSNISARALNIFVNVCGAPE